MSLLLYRLEYCGLNLCIVSLQQNNAHAHPAVKRDCWHVKDVVVLLYRMCFVCFGLYCGLCWLAKGFDVGGTLPFRACAATATYRTESQRRPTLWPLVVCAFCLLASPSTRLVVHCRLGYLEAVK